MESHLEIIKEKDFIPTAQKAARNMLNFASYLAKDNKQLGKNIYVALIKDSTALEDFLDDHGARNNKTWVYFGEIVASIRNFSNIAYTVSHVLRRLNFYRLDPKKVKPFTKDAENTLQFLNESILALLAHLKKEASLLSLTIPAGRLREEDFTEHMFMKILPHNIDEEKVHDVKENMARVATEFYNITKNCYNIKFERKVPARNLTKLVPEKINEETLRHLESMVHNTQSMYDTYIHKTPVEAEDILLSSLRGHISVTLHLLSIAKDLSHFFERHESKIRNEETRRRIEKIVSSKKVLDSIINFALYYCTIFMKQGQALANTIINQYTIVESVILKVPEGLGFHLRPSTLVAKIANNYGTKITMVVQGKEFDASSVIDLMWAGGLIKREEITEIEFRGDKRALRDLKILAEVNYGEDIMGKSIPLPEEIAYLRQAGP